MALASCDAKEGRHRAQRRLIEAKAARWPRWVISADLGTINPVYERIRKSVVKEIAEPNHCPACRGRRIVMTQRGPRDCERCAGAGVLPCSNRMRAKVLKVSETPYRITWDRPYTWLLGYAADELSAATRALRRTAA